MKKCNIITGCSSFNTTSWKSIFYPDDLPRKEWFNHYCKYFKTYELNGTFYKFPTLKTLQKWHNKAPDDFVFAAKAHKIITHYKKFSNCQEQIESFYDVVGKGLGEKLGFVLFQLPPSFAYTQERLSSIVQALDPAFRNVVEFRHESWWNEAVYDAFKKSSITFCNVNYPNLPTGLVKTTPLCYMRFHGNPKLFYSEYTLEELKGYKKEMLTMDYNEVVVYFNNTASTAGIINAGDFKVLK